ncbi:uncharacterized protein [Parasteatoda tepidariorum]|uniref:uncharacterized protein n=1 Tax=Parasteatoda tepidariorum TaxID=114398 RepID=UPI00077F8723|nr:uncharacterized protein LOC107450507 [Parasteatoda tepidariorum]
MGIVGPLSSSDGYSYLLTMIERFSRWPEAIPIADMQAKTICRAIFHTWISRFGCPSIITTNQGSQMRSSLYREFSGMKTHHENSQWTEVLPVVLLGIRTAVKEDINASCAELVYGTTLQLPSDMIETSIIPTCDDIFVDRLKAWFLRKRRRQLETNVYL